MIVITGGAGFIGSNLVKSFNDAGRQDILIVDHLKNSAKMENLRGLQFLDYQDKTRFLSRVEQGGKGGTDHDLLRELKNKLDTLAPQLPDFAYYELPTIGSSFKWMRAVIDGGMKQGIPDRAQRDRTITLYLDVDWFRAQIGTAGNDSVAALLVDREGNISARWYGRYSAARGDSLRGAVVEAR